MIRPRRHFEEWQPLVGPRFAQRITVAWAPAETLVIIVPIWWLVGLTMPFAAPPLHAVLQPLNAAIGLLVIATAGLSAILLRRVSVKLFEELRERGVSIETKPSLGTRKRFRRWLDDQGLTASEAFEYLEHA